jgi:hypothetical protein
MWSETDNGADWVQEVTRIGCSGRAPLVAMMKATDLRNTHDGPPFRWLHRSFYGCVFVQGQVTAGVMVVVQEGLQIAGQAPLVEDNHVIQTFPANGPDDPFHIRALPRRAWR